MLYRSRLILRSTAKVATSLFADHSPPIEKHRRKRCKRLFRPMRGLWSAWSGMTDSKFCAIAILPSKQFEELVNADVRIAQDSSQSARWNGPSFMNGDAEGISRSPACIQCAGQLLL